MAGFIKLNRNIKNWRWYKSPNDLIVFLYMLLTAAYEPTECMQHNLKRGELIASISFIAAETGLTIQQVKTSVKHLMLTNEITKRSTTKNTVFKVENYDQFIDANQLINQQITNDQPTNNQRVTNEQPTSNQQVTNKQPTNKKEIKEIQEIQEVKEVKEILFASTVYTLPAVGGKKVAISKEQFEKWQTLYPAVDVMQELKKMDGWLNANPTRIKTAKGIPRFVNSWLARQQDKAKPAQRRQDVLPSYTPNESEEFNRDEFEEIRKKLKEREAK